MKRRTILFFFIASAIQCLGQTYESEIEAAKAGDANSQYWIGSFYENGTGGVEQNDSLAFVWYKKSANQEFKLGLASLANCYKNGRGVKQDFYESFQLYNKAAKLGHANSQKEVGLCYEFGEGVAQDYCLAAEWYKKAADNGSKAAKQYLARVEPRCPAPPSLPTPFLIVSDFKLNGDGKKLQKKQPVELTILLTNQEKSIAENVTAQIKFPEGVLSLENDLLSFSYIKGNETKSLSYSFYISDNYTSTTIPVKLVINEKNGKHAEDWEKLFIIGQSFNSDISDIDVDIPVTSISQPNTYAMIVAEENYRNETSVPYAINDGTLFMEYCIKTLGIPENNIIFKKDITKSEFNYNLRRLKNLVNQKNNHDEVKIIFYYAGHGIPGKANDFGEDENNKAYLLFSDGYVNDAESGIRLNDLYYTIADFNAQSVSVFLDACFSGNTRNGEMTNEARGPVIIIDEDELPNRMVVFAAAKDDESAFSYPEKQHGIFTYFLLKKLKESSGEVSYGELSKYINREVNNTSFQLRNKEQTPTTESSIVGWEKMRLK